MNNKNGNVTTTEVYRNVITELIEKINPVCLKRIYKLVSYLYTHY